MRLGVSMDYPRQNQHHVSEALLKQFAIPGEMSMVYQFDKKTCTTRKRPTKFSESSSQGSPYWTGEHESYLQRMENKAIPLIKRLSSTEELTFGRYSWMPSTLTFTEREDLILFIAMLDVTSDMVKMYRNKEYDGRDRIANELRSFGLSQDPSAIESLYHAIPDLSRTRIEEHAAQYFSSLALQTIRVPDGLAVLPDIAVCGRFVIAMPPPWDHFVLPISPTSVLLGCHPDMISYFTLRYIGKGLRETLCGEPHSRYIYSSTELPRDFRSRSIWPELEGCDDYDESLWNPRMILSDG